MIIRLDIENFRSIKDRVSISFETTSNKEMQNNYLEVNGNSNILKSSVIYGANASGKSNVLKAFSAIIYLVNRSHNYTIDDGIAPYEPYLLDEISKQSPVFFEIEFLVDNKKYIYSINYLKHRILEEGLWFYPNRTKAKLFVRNEDIYKYGTYFKGEKKSIQNQTLPNQLFLSKALVNNVESILAIGDYFKHQITYQSNNSSIKIIDDTYIVAKRLIESENRNFSTKYNKLISLLDTGINQVVAKEVEVDESEILELLSPKFREVLGEKFKEQKNYRLQTKHDVYKNNNLVDTTLFPKELESLGTNKLFVLLETILNCLDDGKTIIIDEFEQNLHPHLTKVLIKLFHNPNINKKNAQLIFATHDISQLDNQIFRKDQVWFTEKDLQGNSSLFCLADFGDVNQDTPFDTWYNSERFGATPIINEIELEKIFSENYDQENSKEA